MMIEANNERMDTMQNNLRFLTQAQYAELINLYHLARVPLSGTGKTSRYDQMIWATSEFHKLHPEVSATAAYKDLSANM